MILVPVWSPLRRHARGLRGLGLGGTIRKFPHLVRRSLPRTKGLDPLAPPDRPSARVASQDVKGRTILAHLLVPRQSGYHRGPARWHSSACVAEVMGRVGVVEAEGEPGDTSAAIRDGLRLIQEDDMISRRGRASRSPRWRPLAARAGAPRGRRREHARSRRPRRSTTARQSRAG